VADARAPSDEDDHQMRGNRWGDGPDTPDGVRDRAARANDRVLDELLARVDDTTIALAIRGVKDLERHWMTLPPGRKLMLAWPLLRSIFVRATENDP
jgi:hypothetical protein